MKIILDNIIFSLQKSGGISTLWGEFIICVFGRNKDAISVLEYQNFIQNIVRNDLSVDFSGQILNNGHKRSLWFERFINPSLPSIEEKFIFISSYYRTSSNKKAINVTVVHDFTHEKFHGKVRRLIHSAQKRMAVRNSSGIICISENTKKDLLQYFPEAKDKKIRVIPNGVADQFSKIDNYFSWNEIKGGSGFLDDKKCILFIGQRSGYKNFSNVILAIKEMPIDYNLIVVGRKFTETESILLNKTLSSDRYILLSEVSNEKLNMIYNKCFCLVYPSLYEGFGIPILESMKAGTPVIAFNGSSIPEVSGDAAILLDEVTPGKIIQAISTLEDAGTYEKLSLAGIEQAKKFSWKSTMNNYLKFFNELYNDEK